MQEPRRRDDVVRGVDVSSLTAGPDGDGSGPADEPVVVLLHGLAMSNRYLRPAMRRLADEHRVLAPDLPGVGRSGRASRRLSMADLADGLVEWLDEVGVRRATVVGHSLGCTLAAVLAERHPDRVVAVVLASPAPDPGFRPLLRQAWRLLTDGPREKPSMVLIALSDYLRLGPRWVLRAMTEARRSDTAADLDRVQQPTLVVRGGRDPLVSPAWADTLVDRLPRAELVTLDDAPHGLPYSAADPFAATVRAFVARRVTEGC